MSDGAAAGFNSEATWFGIKYNLSAPALWTLDNPRIDNKTEPPPTWGGGRVRLYSEPVSCPIPCIPSRR
jgi:hypothetical protein